MDINFPFLRPISWLYRAICAFRRKGILAFSGMRWKSPVPVIVVGNITVGGTGKTPLLMSIAEYFKTSGLRVGIVSRGYRGKGPFPCLISTEGPEHVGDEPLLIAQKTGLPVVVDPSRNRAIQRLLKAHSVDLILSDDGLQHYAMARTVEIAVVDAAKGFGNGYGLPAGPLREPVDRLNTVDLIVLNETLQKKEGSFFAESALSEKTFSMKFFADRLLFSGNPWILSEIKTLHVVAGIGHPERWMETVKTFWRDQGLELPVLVTHFFEDHHPFSLEDFQWMEPETWVVMTEKDAVKVNRLAWSLRQRDQIATLTMGVEISSVFFDRLIGLLRERGEAF